MNRVFGITVAAIALLVGAAIPASAAESMRVTFVRHGESEGNASGLIDTSTPGPVLTPLGQQQARDVAELLGDNNYDAIYSSTMVRTQLTAAPMSQYLGLPIQVLPGLQEIEAGVFEGTPEAGAASGYGLYPIGWALPGVIPQIPVDRFNKGTYMPGTDQNGYVFDARVRGALQTMYDNGDRNAVVFSHGGTIMFWTMMNVNNLTAIQKLQLLQAAQLGNTDYVVIEGNNEDGWTLVNWNGQQFSPEPTLRSEIALQQRTLKRQLAATANEVAQAFATRDIAKILTAINRGAADTQFSLAKYRRAVNAKIINEIGKVTTPPAPTEDTAAPHSEIASVSAASGNSETAKSSESEKVGSNDIAARVSAAAASFGAKPRNSAKESDADAVEAEDATDGNKTEPPARTTRPARTGNRGPITADDVRDYVSKFTPKRATDKADSTTSETTGTSGTADSAGSSDGDSGGSQSNAA
jgi:broad specificity phosphatase PhoE